VLAVATLDGRNPHFAPSELLAAILGPVTPETLASTDRSPLKRGEPVFLGRERRCPLDPAAELEVNGILLSMESGDWVLLPRHTPHRLVRTTPRTGWLAASHLWWVVRRKHGSALRRSQEELHDGSRWSLRRETSDVTVDLGGDPCRDGTAFGTPSRSRVPR
jgi:hypothetical protein